MRELHLVETHSLSHSWRQTLKQLLYNSSQKITYQCADNVSGISLETILYNILTLLISTLKNHGPFLGSGG